MHFFVPVHLDLPVGCRGQRDPSDLSSVVAAINATEDHLTALLTLAERLKNKQTRFTCKFNLKRIAHCEAKDFHPVSVPAQVDGEQRLGHEFLLHHTIEDGHDVVRGNGLEGQTQDAISQHVGHEGSLCLAQSKHLIGHRDAANLDTDDDCQSKLNGPQRYCMPVRSINILSILFQGFCLPQQCHWPDIQSCCQCRTGWTEACCPSGRWTTAVGWISCGSLQENNFSFKFTFHYNTEQLSLSSES